MHRLRQLLMVLGVGLLLCTAPRAAYAAPDNSEARQRYDEGRRLYDLHDYEGALAAFKRAYLISDQPALLYDMAMCLERLERRAEAVELYRSFLLRSPRLAREQVAEVESVIRELEHPAGDALTVSAPPPLPPRPPPAPVPIYRRWWPWTILGVGVVAGVGLGVGLGLGLRHGGFDATLDPVALR